MTYKYSENDVHSPDDELYVPVEHHDDGCEIYFQYEHLVDKYRESCRGFWCATHGQWTYNFPLHGLAIWEKERPVSDKDPGKEAGGE